jgi:hypothetical protein
VIVDQSGEIIESVFYIDLGNSYATDVIETSDGGYLIYGLQSASGTDQNLIARKISSEGLTDWSNTYDMLSNYFPAGIVETPDGSYVALSTQVWGDGFTINRMMIESDGSQGLGAFKPVNNEIAVDIELLSDDTLLIAGYNSDTWQRILRTYDLEGTMLDEYVFGSDSSKPIDLVVTSSEESVLLGYEIGDVYHPYIAKTESLVTQKGSLKLTVRDSEDVIIPDSNIYSTSTPEAQQSLSGITNSHGYVAFSDLLPGAYQFIVTKTGYSDETITLHVNANSETTETVSLVEFSGDIIITVENNDGMTLAGAQIMHVSKLPAIMGNTDETGQAAFIGVEVGQYTVQVSYEDYVSEVLTIESVLSSTTQYTVVLEPVGEEQEPEVEEPIAEPDAGEEDLEAPDESETESAEEGPNVDTGESESETGADTDQDTKTSEEEADPESGEREPESEPTIYSPLVIGLIVVTVASLVVTLYVLRTRRNSNSSI